MLKKSLVLAALASSQCFAAVPSQYIAKLYTEALGRAPDTSGWQGNTNYAVANSCSIPMLQSIAASVFSSAEYTDKGYTPEETVLTVYRAMFSREPDTSGFAYYVNYIRSGNTAAAMAQGLAGSQEFAQLAATICKGNGYGPVVVNPPVDIGSGTWTQQRLETCLSSSSVCSIPPRTVVYVNSTVTVPAGKVLETQGGPDRYKYARQARIVRASLFYGPLIVMKAGSTVRNIWVSGGRDRFASGLQERPNPIDNVFPNIIYVGGNYGIIDGVRSDAPLTATHIATYPFPYPTVPTPPSAFAGSIQINNNLTTGYSHSHHDDQTPGTPVVWADGISNHITGAIITGNHIVDPTDVGIVIFGHDGADQHSTASGNLIVHAGLSAYGSIGMDTTQCLQSADACKFSGPGFTNNTIFGGKNQHSDIVVYNGTAAWLPASCSGRNDTACGAGAQMSNNRTILGDPNQVLMAQIGIAVDGMKNAVTYGNQLSVTPVTNETVLRCRRNDQMIVNALSAGHASGTLQAGLDADIDGCIGH